MKLIVPGGNGFIGAEICRCAVQHGHDVAAFGRTGRPARPPSEHPWIQEVEWRAADVFSPDSWRDLLTDADAVVHSLATIREDPAHNVTFQRVNGESALIAAQEAVEAHVDAFVFLSVRNNPPFVSTDFLASKRRAERDLTEQFPSLRTVVLRPNLVFGPQRRGSAVMAALLNQLPESVMGGYAAHAGRPLPVELVAAAAVHAAITPTLDSTLTVDQIADLGRTSGLITPENCSAPASGRLLAGLGGAVVGGWLLKRWWDS